MDNTRNNEGRTQVLVKGKQFLFLIRQTRRFSQIVESGKNLVVDNRLIFVA